MQRPELLKAIEGLSDRHKAQLLAEIYQAAGLNNEGSGASAFSVNWTPYPGPQSEALTCPADELFYGGAAGGGKSFLLMGAALTQHWRSIIFRKTFPQFAEIIDKLWEIAGRDNYNAQSHTVTLPNGRKLELGSVPLPKKREDYKGRAHDLKGFDELPDFSKADYRFLIAWNRTTKPGQRCRVIATGNPPTTPEGEWVNEYWGPWLNSQHPNPAQSGELRWYANVEERGGEIKEIEVETGAPFDHKGKLIKPRSRCFIKASLEDNPAYMASGYDATLEALPEPLRSLLRYGRFDMTQEDRPFQVIPTAWVKAAMDRWKKRPRPDLKLATVACDVARGGDDKTTIAKRYGDWVAPLVKYSGRMTKDGDIVADLIIKELIEDNESGREKDNPKYTNPDGVAIVIDAIGIGASAYDSARRKISKGVRAFVGSEAAADTRDKTGRFKFANKRAESYWKLREALDPSRGATLALPDDPELRADLCAPLYSVEAGKILVEPKDKIKARIGRSPDCGDAVTMALFQSVNWF